MSATRIMSGKKRLLSPVVAVLGSAVLAPSTLAGPLDPQLASAWRQAQATYRQGDLVGSYRQFVPLVARGAALDDQLQRFLFIRDAASATCMAGYRTQAIQLAARLPDTLLPPANPAVDYLSFRSPNDDIRLTDVSNIGDLRRGSGFSFVLPGDFRDASGRLVDHNGNGRLDEGTYHDIDGRLIGEPVSSRQLRPFQSFFLWQGTRDACSLGVAADLRTDRIAVARGSKPSFGLRCTWARTCTGRLSLTRTLNNGIGPTLASGRYSIPGGQRKTIRLTPTKTGRASLKRGTTRVDLNVLPGTSRNRVASRTLRYSVKQAPRR